MGLRIKRKGFKGAELPVEGDLLIADGKHFHIMAITNEFIFIESEDGETQTLYKDDFSFDFVDPMDEKFIDNSGAE
jgi:hypothetical protein